MGWKNVKEHFRIKHIVQVTSKGICIGSGYIHDIIVVGLDGVVKKRYEKFGSNEDLARYQKHMDAAPEKLKELVLAPDTFAEDIIVYTFDDGMVIEKRCEKLGWPNVTHDGLAMYENTFSPDREQVILWAKKDAEAAVRHGRESVADAEKTLAERQERLAIYESRQAKLLNDFPAN